MARSSRRPIVTSVALALALCAVSCAGARETAEAPRAADEPYAIGKPSRDGIGKF